MNFFLLCIATMLVTNGATACKEVCDTGKIQNEDLKVAVSFSQAGLIKSNILPVPPTALLRVIFESAEANLGNILYYPAQTQSAPSFEYADADPAVNYTIVIINADPISCTTAALRFYLNSLCVNIRGTEINEKNGNQIASYIDDYTAKESGTKREMALLYAQPCYIDPMNRPLVDASIRRLSFNLTEFVSNFTLGDPVAGNFWRSAACHCGKYCKTDLTGSYGKQTEYCIGCEDCVQNMYRKL